MNLCIHIHTHTEKSFETNLVYTVKSYLIKGKKKGKKKYSSIYKKKKKKSKNLKTFNNGNCLLQGNTSHKSYPLITLMVFFFLLTDICIILAKGNPK